MNHFYEKIGEDWFTYSLLYSKMVKEAPSEARFVEVGSWKGRSSAYMGVEIHNSGKKIHFDCVDTWMGSIEHQNDPFVLSDMLYFEFLKNTESLRHIIRPIRSTSLDAAKLYGDESLDFVFIDASHEYEDVMNDIITWFPKVKNGGVISGHDYRGDFPGVIRAVNDFFEQKKIKFEQFLDCWTYKK